MMTHRLEKPYKCSSCEDSFKYKSDFLKHERTHALDKPYQCSVCNKTYSLKSSLMNHLRTHRVKTPYKCNNCDKLFTNKKILETHLKTHTGEKTYKCSNCDKEYISQDSLMRHLKTHDVEIRAGQDKKQDNLKLKRLQKYDAIKRRKKFECSFTESEVLIAATNYQKELEEKNGIQYVVFVKNHGIMHSSMLMEQFVIGVIEKNQMIQNATHFQNKMT